MFNLDPSGLGCFFPFLFSRKEGYSKILCDRFNLPGSEGVSGPVFGRAERKTALIITGSVLSSEQSSSSRVLATQDIEVGRKERVSGLRTLRLEE